MIPFLRVTAQFRAKLRAKLRIIAPLWNESYNRDMSEPCFPVFLDLLGAPVLVVGGESQAEVVVERLLRAGARVTVVAPRAGARIQLHSEEERLRWVARPYAVDALEEAMLVFACAGDPAVQHQVCEDARALGLWVHRSDEQADSTFHLPHFFERGPVKVAVHADSSQPALTERIALVVSQAAGHEFGTLSEWLSEPRGDAPLRIAGEDFRRDLCATVVLKSNVLELLREGRHKEARTRFEDLRRQCESSWSA